MKDIFRELAIGDVLESEFNAETEIFRSCMRSFFRDKYGNDPRNIRRLYKERIGALHKVKIHQIAHIVEVRRRRLPAYPTSLRYAHE